MHWFVTLLRYECLLVLRSGKDIALMLGFGLIALSLMALLADTAWLQQAAAGMIWTVVLFSVLLMIERIFHDDQQSGRLDIVLIQPIPFWVILLAKVGGFWLRTGLPIIITIPVAMVFLNLPFALLPVLMLSLVLGTLSLSLFATIGAALALGARQPTLLVMVLVLPLLIPVVVFGALILERSLGGHGIMGPFLWLGVCLCLGLLCVPLGALALRGRTVL